MFLYILFDTTFFPAHLWVQSNPQGKDTFLHSDADILSQLPAHLVSVLLFFERSASVSNVRLLILSLCSGWAVISGSLCVFCCPVTTSSMLMCGNGLIHQLLQTYILFGKRALKLVFF